MGEINHRLLRKLRQSIVFAIISLTIAHPVCAQDITTGLIGYWDFEEGGGASAADSGSGGNAGTLTNGPVWTTGNTGLGGAIDFDGSDDYVTIANEAAFDFTQTDSFTLAGWIFRDTDNTEDDIFGKSDDHGASYWDGYTVFLDDSGNLIAGLRCNNGFGGLYESAAAPSTGAWHHIAITYDGSRDASGFRIFVDGAGVSTSVLENNLGSCSTNITNNRPFMIGAYDYLDAYTFDGKIDDVRVYNRELSAPDIAALYAYRSDTGGSFTPYTGPMPCNADYEAVMIYNDDENIMQYCNGSEWVAMGKAGTGAAACDTTPWEQSVPGTYTFTLPANCSAIEVEVFGAGGGGAGDRGGASGGGGSVVIQDAGSTLIAVGGGGGGGGGSSGDGGGGGYADATVISLTPGETFSVWVGGGGQESTSDNGPAGGAVAGGTGNGGDSTYGGGGGGERDSGRGGDSTYGGAGGGGEDASGGGSSIYGGGGGRGVDSGSCGSSSGGLGTAGTSCSTRHGGGGGAYSFSGGTETAGSNGSTRAAANGGPGNGGNNVDGSDGLVRIVPSKCGLGQLCTDGTYYIGINDDTGERLYMSTAAYETSLQWEDVATGDDPADSNWDGEANTLALVNDPSPDHPAADYCYGLSAHGYDDGWYLPAAFELALIWNDGSPIGDIQTDGSWYWSSTEHNFENGNVRRFNDNFTTGQYSSLTELVRCVRKETVAAPSDGTCENPDGVKGEVGFNDDSGQLQYCNGDNWVSAGPKLAQALGSSTTPADCSGLGDAQWLDTDTGNCYYLEDTAADWTTAQANCEADGAYLAVITSDEENTNIYTNLSIGTTETYIGASDIADEGEWRWQGGEVEDVRFWSGTASGSPVGGLYNNWVSTEPNNNAGNQDCASFGFVSEEWNDTTCSNTRPYVCEKPADSHGLLGHWKLDESSGSTVYDSGPSGMHLTWTDGDNDDLTEEVITGKIGTALQGGLSETLTYDPTPYDLGPTESLSIALWFQTATGTGDLVGFGVSGNQISGITLDGRRIRPRIRDDDGLWLMDTNAYTGTNLNDNKWHHFAVVIDRGTGRGKTYLDGVEVRDVDISASVGNIGVKGLQHLRIRTDNMNNKIDDVRFYADALSEEEVQRLARRCFSPPGTSGELVYNADFDIMQYCNGHKWIGIGSLP